MKKIDLHIHTIPTVSDADFVFDLNVLKRYVNESKLDAIAITNHDVFDRSQFSTICNALDILVFPGIEVSLNCGHLLVIDDDANLTEFESRAQQVSSMIHGPNDTITIDELLRIYANLSDYLVIPHYDKKPAISGESLTRIADYVTCGEVDSPKKFIRAIKDSTKLTPVLFSDARIKENMASMPTRQTFVDCGDLTLNALKACLQGHGKVALSEAHGNQLFQVFDDGQLLSTGLNVLLGERSSGKTFTLNKIHETHERVKYIKQFSLVQHEDAEDEREFGKELRKKRSQFAEDYLTEFKTIMNDVMRVDLLGDEKDLESYVDSLIESAKAADRRDAFSNTALFDSSEFPISDDDVLIKLIASIRHVIENVEYQEVIGRHIDYDSLKRLALELIELLWHKQLVSKKKILVNGLVRDIKDRLKMRTSAVQVQDVDLYQVTLNKRRVKRFCEVVKHLQIETTISDEAIQGFRVVTTRGRFNGVGEVKAASGIKTRFKDSFEHYDNPYDYLLALHEDDALTPSELYKLFVKIDYQILNRDGFQVSGGERSEFRLLQEIKDAQNYDMLLIDEPESSFDNIFLRSDVNQIMKEIAENMPVVVVTHNSTVGASTQPDYLIFACKTFENGKAVYRLYSGHPTDLNLISPDGKSISNHKITLDSLEAGCIPYDERRQKYEAIEDRK